MLSESTLTEALNAVRWLVARNVDFAGAVHVIALLAALAEVATPAQSLREELDKYEAAQQEAYNIALDLLLKCSTADTPQAYERAKRAEELARRCREIAATLLVMAVRVVLVAHDREQVRP